MEVCQRLPVSECSPENWYINLNGNQGRPISETYKGTTNNRSTHFIREDLAGKMTDEILNLIPAGTTIITPSGEYSRYPRRVAFLRNYTDCKGVERRGQYVHPVLNDGPGCGDLILDGNGQPIPIGIENRNGSRGKIRPFPYNTSRIRIDFNNDGDTDDTGENVVYCGWGETNGCLEDSPGADGKPYMDSNKEALWFVTVDQIPGTADPPSDDDRNYGYDHPLFYRTLDGQRISSHAPESDGRKWQPLLEPVLQLQAPRNTTSGSTKTLTIADGDKGNRTYWQQQATDAGNTFNLVLASGDTPGRPNEGNGGLENLPRFLESWNAGSKARPAKISGGFIQTKRSEYATAPFETLLPDTLEGTMGEDAGIFGRKQLYEHDNSEGKLPYYNQPDRPWGFDVGLLTQQPDLFAEQFTVPSISPPNEFFQEVSRDDKWVEVLLCAGQADGGPGGNSIEENNKAYYDKPGIGYEYAVSKDQRPDCGEAVKW